MRSFRPQPGYHVLQAEEKDLPLLRSFCDQMTDGPTWPEAAWATIAGPSASISAGRITLVLRDSVQDLVGWVTGALTDGLSELEFLSITPSKRRSGLGRDLLETWLRRVWDQGAQECFLEVRVSNRGARNLYTSCGFVEVGRRKAYYHVPEEDAVVMRLTRPTRVP